MLDELHECVQATFAARPLPSSSRRCCAREFHSPDEGEGVPCVLGTNVGLVTRFAVKFSVFFYHALAVSHTFVGAYRVAEDAISQYVGRYTHMRCARKKTSMGGSIKAVAPFYWEGGVKVCVAVCGCVCGCGCV